LLEKLCALRILDIDAFNQIEEEKERQLLCIRHWIRIPATEQVVPDLVDLSARVSGQRHQSYSFKKAPSWDNPLR